MKVFNLCSSLLVLVAFFGPFLPMVTAVADADAEEGNEVMFLRGRGSASISDESDPSSAAHRRLAPRNDLNVQQWTSSSSTKSFTRRWSCKEKTTSQISSEYNRYQKTNKRFTIYTKRNVGTVRTAYINGSSSGGKKWLCDLGVTCKYGNGYCRFKFSSSEMYVFKGHSGRVIKTDWDNY